ncbi:uncharacterized protein LOC128957130 [Oppia nitens]|uniref:uncharacterized protein LOC128957130 n=1 Tax=Oppia nitens TaxID=1686743 RepID=UPI0023DB450D|nr:uncharacterized protein LOC128957130 [Oppia nitens]
MNRLTRQLSRFGWSQVTRSVSRSWRSWRKTYTEIVYDMSRMSRQRLLFIYNCTAFAATIVPVAVYLSYNTYLLDRQRNWFQLYIDGQPMPLEENLELLALREWNFCHIGRHYKLMDLMMEFFVCNGSEVITVGDLDSRTGSYIGLPHNFAYRTVDDVKLSEILIGGLSAKQLVDANAADHYNSRPAIRQLIESLVLSDNAKRFAIARELHMATNNKLIVDMITIAGSGMLAVGAGQQVILKLNIRRRYLLSFGIRCLSMMLGLAVWFLIRDFLVSSWQKAADESACQQSRDYLDGAVEYYRKLQQRKSALSELNETLVPSVAGTANNNNKLSIIGGVSLNLRSLMLKLFAVKGVPIDKRLDRIYKLNLTYDDDNNNNNNSRSSSSSSSSSSSNQQQKS